MRLPLIPSSSKSFLPQGKSFAPSQAEQLPKLYHSFSVNPLFWGYLNFQVGINKIVSSFDYHPCPWLLASRIHPFIFLSNHWGIISLQNACWYFSQTFIFQHVRKICRFMEFIHLENALIRVIFTQVPPHSNLAHKFLLSRSKQTGITHSLRPHFFENLFPPTVGRGRGNYDLLYQNSVRKYEDDLEHLVFYILHDLQFFPMWWLYSFVNNICHIV